MIRPLALRQRSGVVQRTKSIWQPKCQELAWDSRPANGDHNVLFAVEHIGHGRSGLTGGHRNGTGVAASGFVVRAQERALMPGGVGEHAGFARND